MTFENGEVIISDSEAEMIFDEFCFEDPFQVWYSPISEKYSKLYEFANNKGFEKTYMCDFICNSDKDYEERKLFSLLEQDDNDGTYIVPVQVFFWLCEKGHFDEAKELFSLGDVCIRQSFKNGFHNAFDNGHYEIAKWLFDLAKKSEMYDEDGLYYDIEHENVLGNVYNIMKNCYKDSCKKINKLSDFILWLKSIID